MVASSWPFLTIWPSWNVHLGQHARDLRRDGDRGRRRDGAERVDVDRDVRVGDGGDADRGGVRSAAPAAAARAARAARARARRGAASAGLCVRCQARAPRPATSSTAITVPSQRRLVFGAAGSVASGLSFLFHRGPCSRRPRGERAFATPVCSGTDARANACASSRPRDTIANDAPVSASARRGLEKLYLSSWRPVSFGGPAGRPAGLGCSPA